MNQTQTLSEVSLTSALESFRNSREFQDLFPQTDNLQHGQLSKAGRSYEVFYKMGAEQPSGFPFHDSLWHNDTPEQMLTQAWVYYSLEFERLHTNIETIISMSQDPSSMRGKISARAEQLAGQLSFNLVTYPASVLGKAGLFCELTSQNVKAPFAWPMPVNLLPVLINQDDYLDLLITAAGYYKLELEGIINSIKRVESQLKRPN